MKSETVRKLEFLRTSFNSNGKVSKTANLVQYFNNAYTFLELKAVIDLLDDVEKETVYAVCGPMLDGNDTTEVSKALRTKFNTHFIPPIFLIILYYTNILFCNKNK